MIKKILTVAAAFLAASTVANATIFALSQPAVQQSVPTANTATGLAATTGSGIWTYDDVTKIVRQTGSNTLTFGPALPGSVGYVLNITGMVITIAGTTTATSYTCTDGIFATSFIFASFCGGYSYNASGNFTNDSTLSPDACVRTVNPDDYIEAPTLCITNTFNNGLAGTYALTVRDTSTPGTLKVRQANYVVYDPPNPPTVEDPDGEPSQSAYGLPQAGWEFTFTIGAALPDTDSDGIADPVDNCTLVSNTATGTVPNSPGLLRSQLDSDNDGYGNACDPDVNQSGGTTATDYSILRSVIGKLYNFSVNAAKSDINASGSVTAADYAILRSRIGTPPGPSGLACAGTIPCPLVP